MNTSTPTPDTKSPVFPRDLIARYDTAGPRYTSYPTAVQFHAGFTGQKLREIIAATNAAPTPPPLSIYVHLPFCRTLCYFCALNVVHTKDQSLAEHYVDTVVREMDLVVPSLKPGREVVQLHWGGGTPTFAPPRALERLARATRDRFAIARDVEMGVEIDPREMSDEHFEVLRAAGFNRLSMGVQDFDPEVQVAVHRLQSEEVTRWAIESGRKHGFASVNVDLIYGLPHQTTVNFARTLERIVEMNPDRVALFNLAYLPELARHQRAIKPETLPAPDEKLAILELAVSKLTEAGYVFIGMDHFARPEDPLTRALEAGTLYRNFQGYTTSAGADLYAFGVSAVSSVGPSFSQNDKDLAAYTSRVEAGELPVLRGVELTPEDHLRRAVILALMCHFVVVKRDFEAQYGVTFDSHFADALATLAPMAADGVVKLAADRIEVTPRGRFLVRNVAMAFDAYLADAQGARFSRTV